MRPGLALVLCGVVACSGKTSTGTTGPATGSGAAGSAHLPISTPVGPATTPLSAAPGVRVTLADVGLEASSLDRTADPCVDFYQFACGGWLANTPIPPDRARWGRLDELDQRATAALRAMLEEAAKGIGADAATRQLGDYYAACMDEAAIERDGLAAIKPALATVAKVGTSARSWMAAISELHRVGIWVVWRADAAADREDATTTAMYLGGAALGLRDRAPYVTASSTATLDAYRSHVAKLLGLAGVPAPRLEAAAGEVLAIELELARLTPTAAEQRAIVASQRATEPKALARQARSVDWRAYWKALGVEPGPRLVLDAPRLFAGLDKLRVKFRPAQWTSYFTFHLLQHAAFALPGPFADQAFELERLVTGVAQPPDRGTRCVAAVGRGLGDLLGRAYATKLFPASAKQTATMLGDALARALGAELTRVSWMADETRQLALAKAGKLVRMIGHPDQWRSYDAVVTRDDFAGNAWRAAGIETRRRLSRWGRPVDRAAWQLDAFSVAVSYDPQANTVTVPVGVLQPPVFGSDRSVAANLGGLGTLLGHELTHGFDERGARYDAAGTVQSWWTAEDTAAYAQRARCVAEQYAAFEAMPKGFVDGPRTLAENVADHGGVKLAFAAYRALRADAAKLYVADGYTEDQQFFIAVGQALCTRDRPAEVARRLAHDPYAPPKFRVYGSLRNLKEFSEAFSCAPGTPMNPAKSCSVW